MFIHTDFLRAALCCVADEKEERKYLRGVRITPTHIQACNPGACVSMEHGGDSTVEGVFIFDNLHIPDSAEMTDIGTFDGEWFAIHYDENEYRMGFSRVTKIECRYPDFSKLLPAEPEPCDALPAFQAKYLALPQQMFGDLGCVAVKFKPYGKEAGCQLIFDDGVNYMYGNPFMVIMPLRDNAFDLLAEVLNEKGI